MNQITFYKHKKLIKFVNGSRILMPCEQHLHLRNPARHTTIFWPFGHTHERYNFTIVFVRIKVMHALEHPSAVRYPQKAFLRFG